MVSQQNTIAVLEANLSNTTNINASLQEVLAEKEALLKQKEQLMVVYQRNETKEEKIRILEPIVLKLIADSTMTLDGITQKLIKLGFDTNLDEVHEVLIRIKAKYGILRISDTIPRSYKLGPIGYRSNMNVTLDANGKDCVDILLVGDEHVDANDNRTLKNFDALYNYCKKNGLNLIMHLGDFLDFNNDYSDLSKKLENYEKDINALLAKYPYDETIMNAYLGGNHEKRMISCGLDPVEYICDVRRDFNPLGYTNAMLNIGNSQIAIHHPNESFQDDIKDAVPIVLKEYYDKVKIDRKTVYLDILGHYHKCYLNQAGKYFLAPSYNFTAGSTNGACHLKIYLDSSGKISGISFIILPIIGNKLVPAGELEYKKILK